MFQSLIDVRDLRKTFSLKQKSPGFGAGLRSLLNPEMKTVHAVDGISFQVAPGELLAFIGPNGAGKSTTIKMLTGILFPTSGELSVLGLNPQRDRKKLAFQIGSVFGQKPQLWYHLPPIDTYQLFSRIYELEPKRFRARLDMLVKAFEIEPLLRTPVRKLSLGQRMRCEIAASLLHEPKIIFLDEPTIGLDVVAKQQIREVIRHLNRNEGVTIFLTSHDAGDIETLAQRTVVVNHGKIVFDDTTERFKKGYIRSKTVELVLDGEGEGFQFDSAKILERSKFRVKVEIDTTGPSSIDRLLSYAVENFDLKDVNIYEPPMEEIISTIYQEARV